MRVALLLLAACHAGVVQETNADAPFEQTLPDGSCTTGPTTGTLPGVTIEITSSSCVYHQGSAATFPYVVTIDDAFPAIDVPASDTCDCHAPDMTIASWVSVEIGGGTQHYCLCDTGCCAPESARTIKLAPGTLGDTLAWSGRNWSGPSDTGNPEGAYFATGQYDVVVSFSGYDHGTVEARLPIEIVP